MAIYLGNLKVNATAGTTEGGSSGTTIEPLSVTSNGTYSAPTGTAYSPVTVSVPTLSASAITLTENGVYSAPTGYAYSPVTVSVSGGGSADYLDARAALSGSYYSTATSIPECAFAGMENLTDVSLPNITSIPSAAFMSCYNMETINAPSVKSINVSAFYRCNRLLYASFPECTATNAGAFYYCSSMSYASFPKLTTINGFSYCFKLTTFYAPLATSIVGYGLYDNSALTSVTLSSLRGVGNQAFRYC